MHRLTEKQQTDPAAYSSRSTVPAKLRPDAFSVVGLFGRKALQTRRFCERWYRLRLFIAKVLDVTLVKYCADLALYILILAAPRFELGSYLAGGKSSDRSR